MATQEEIDGTVKVMGGEDWQLWIDALREADVPDEGAKTTAFTYLGEKLTRISTVGTAPSAKPRRTWTRKS